MACRTHSRTGNSRRSTPTGAPPTIFLSARSISRTIHCSNGLWLLRTLSRACSDTSAPARPEFHLRSSESPHLCASSEHDVCDWPWSWSSRALLPIPILKEATRSSIRTLNGPACPKSLFRQFSWPYGIPSHDAPNVPGSINEGGELGYSVVHAFGAAFDNPDLIVACVVGDGKPKPVLSRPPGIPTNFSIPSRTALFCPSFI